MVLHTHTHTHTHQYIYVHIYTRKYTSTKEPLPARTYVAKIAAHFLDTSFVLFFTAEVHGLRFTDCGIPSAKAERARVFPLRCRQLPVCRRTCPKAYRTLSTTHGDVPMSHADVPMSHGDIPMSHGDIPMSRGDIPMRRGDIPMSRGDIPISRGDVPEGSNRAVFFYCYHSFTFLIINQKILTNNNQFNF
jgi:hypothetical protein